LTGGDTLTANFMRQDHFQFKPQFKPLISANHKPQLRSVDTAMRRRMNLIPFSVTIPPEKRDNELKAKLKDEGPGILQWLIDGCLAYQRMALAPPKSVVEATNDYFKSEDGVANWIEEWCEVGEGLFEASSRLFASWRYYAEQGRLLVGNNKTFKAELNRLGYHERRGSAGIAYYGLQIRDDAPRPQAGDPGPGGSRGGCPDPDHMEDF
jgi:putative DNA primase/helicase